MFNKSKKENTTKKLNTVMDETYIKAYPQPAICLFDFDEEVEKNLAQLKFNCTSGTFGTSIRVNNEQRNDQKLLKLNHDYPDNLHEFDVVVLDMTKNHVESYDPKQHVLENTKGATARAILSRYPEQIFDPRPFSINIVAAEIDNLIREKSIIIAFCMYENIATYELFEITSHGSKVTGKQTLSNFNFYSRMPQRNEKYGKKVKLVESTLSPLLKKHLSKMEYGTVFSHATVIKNNYERHQDKDFFPLLLNEQSEIVGYVHILNGSLVLVLPNIHDKVSFIGDLLNIYLPEVRPDIFPFHGEFGWLENGEYLLPGESELLLQRKAIEEKYSNDIEQNEVSISSLKEQYKFLRDLISESGENLVNAVEHYLEWLGFESVVNLDNTNPEILEEDLQVDCGERFLVIEVKGIGGTSTDKDCSQISKIKHRRAEQRNAFDVFGLYIVNHQRYMPPRSRSNPPFTKNQIKDAKLDKRGLLTAYDLYKAYFLVEAGILDKAFVKENLFKTGLISLEPNHLISIGIPTEYYQDNQVVIVNLDGILLSKGSRIIVKKQDDYSKVIIESLKVDDTEVSSVDAGEVGIKFDRPIKKKSELFVEKA